jgi:hypothetical protein
LQGKENKLEKLCSAEARDKVEWVLSGKIREDLMELRPTPKDGEKDVSRWMIRPSRSLIKSGMIGASDTPRRADPAKSRAGYQEIEFYSYDTSLVTFREIWARFLEHGALQVFAYLSRVSFSESRFRYT